ncbi:hypothetical protein B0H13DRAFT_2348817 [Mycena leptocephala]|nr:hypothetical protein B0H13DRAFT_2348817 [Mycena leptocephala]
MNSIPTFSDTSSMTPLAITLIATLALLSTVQPNLAQVVCNPPCTDGLFNTIGSSRNSTTYTNGIADQYAQCLDCQDQMLGDSVTSSQNEYDAYVFLCSDAGVKLKNQTVAGSFQSSGTMEGKGSQGKPGASVHLRASRFVVGRITIGVLCAVLI